MIKGTVYFEHFAKVNEKWAALMDVYSLGGDKNMYFNNLLTYSAIFFCFEYLYI